MNLSAEATTPRFYILISSKALSSRGSISVGLATNPPISKKGKVDTVKWGTNKKPNDLAWKLLSEFEKPENRIGILGPRRGEVCVYCSYSHLTKNLQKKRTGEDKNDVYLRMAKAIWPDEDYTDSSRAKELYVKVKNKIDQ